jgi:WD40 repeat protein
MSDVFISYSRKDIAFARRLHAGLAQAGLETWIDWQDIPPSSDWLAEVYSAIEASDAFIFIISADSVDSEICSHEIAHAVQNYKRLIPIVLDDIPARSVTPELAALNWIFFREHDDFDASVQTLLAAIQTDQAWTKMHTRYQNRALEWERHHEDAGYLLRGQDLAQAEGWLAGAAEKDPQPTPLQARYILAGRQAGTRLQRRIMSGALLGVVIMTALAVAAWKQRGQAVGASHVRATAQSVAEAESNTRATAEAVAVSESHQRATAQAEAEAQREEAILQRDTATSRQVAAQALIHLRPEELDFALLMGVTATQIQDTLEARSILMRALTYRPHLIRMLHGSLWSTSVGYQGLAISPDGSMVAAADNAKRILLWDTATGSQIGEPLLGTDGYIACLEFSPDGSILASGDFNTDLILWDVASHEILQKIFIGDPSRKVYIHDIAFSPRGDLIAASSNYHYIRIWDMEREELVQSGYDPYGRIFSLDFNPQGTLLAVGDKDDSYPYDDLGKVLLWDVVGGDWIGEPYLGQYEGVRRLTFSPDGSTIAAAGNVDWLSGHSGEILFWNVASGEPIPHALNKLDERLYNLFYTPDGRRLISDYGKSIQVWDAQTGAAIGRPFTFDTTWNALELNQAGDFLASVRKDGAVLLWDLVDRAANIEHPLAASSGATALAVHPNGETLAAAICTSTAHAVSGCLQSEIRICSLETEACEEGPTLQKAGTVRGMAFSSQGQLATLGAEGEIRLWDWEAGQALTALAMFEVPQAEDLTFSSDGSTLAVAGPDGITLLDAARGEIIDRLLAGACTSVGFSADGGILLAGGQDGTVTVLEMSSHEMIGQPLAVHNAPLTGAALNPDGMMLALSTADGNLILWDMLAGSWIGLPIAADAQVLNAVAFLPDGSLATAGVGGVSLWEMELSAWQDHACRIANRNLTEQEWATYLGDIPYRVTCPNLP